MAVTAAHTKNLTLPRPRQGGNVSARSRPFACPRGAPGRGRIPSPAGCADHNCRMEHDDVGTALDELAAAAQANIDEWTAVLARIAQVRELREQGTPYVEMKIETDGPTIIGALSRNQERLTLAGAHVRRALARELSSAGWSQAQIAQAFGVSRQRVAALLSP